MLAESLASALSTVQQDSGACMLLCEDDAHPSFLWGPANVGTKSSREGPVLVLSPVFSFGF